MNLELNQNELHACRAFNRLVAMATEGWDQLQAADAHWDGGEWSGPAWGDNWQEVEEHYQKVIAEKFDLPSDEYVMQMIWLYEGNEEQQWWNSHHIRWEVWGSMGEGTEQFISDFSSRRAAALFVDKLNNRPDNHPDLHYWFEKKDERPFPTDAYGEDMRNL